jgi:uncharacterized membrane protein
MAPIPYWALAAIFWLHFLATVTWVGSLFAMGVLLLPAARRALQPPEQLALISAVQQRLEPVAWFCMGLLLVTGLFQLSSSPHYDGFLDISGEWSMAMLVKHSLAVVMVVVSAIQTWEVLPAIRRALLRRKTARAEELAALQRRETILLSANVALGLLILAATAAAGLSDDSVGVRLTGGGIAEPGWAAPTSSCAERS